MTLLDDWEEFEDAVAGLKEAIRDELPFLLTTLAWTWLGLAAIVTTWKAMR